MPKEIKHDNGRDKGCLHLSMKYVDSWESFFLQKWTIILIKELWITLQVRIKRPQLKTLELDTLNPKCWSPDW